MNKDVVEESAMFSPFCYLEYCEKDCRFTGY
jgi:hypothetical protein